jgi:hypothetical protein
MTMNIYKVSRTDTVGWDQYDAFVCIAETEEAARNMHPYEDDHDDIWDIPDTYDDGYRRNTGWVKRKEIGTLKIEHIGTADGLPGIILSSFCAG